MKKTYREETTAGTQGESRELQLAQLAARIRKRRMLTEVILIAAVCIVTICFFNYREAGMRPKPPIIIGTSGHGSCSLAAGTRSATIYYSLSFKQVSYESEYGSNYSQRLWLWETVEKKPDTLTSEQYRQLMEQMKRGDDVETLYERKAGKAGAAQGHSGTFQKAARHLNPESLF